jgi:hypothetical protein
MDRYKLIVLLCLFIASPVHAGMMMMTGDGTSAACAASFIEDAFTRGDSGTVGGDWTAEVDTGGLLAISGNTLTRTHSATTAAYVSYTKADAVTEGYLLFKFKVSDTDTGGDTGKSYLFSLRDASDEQSLYVTAENNAAGVWTKLLFGYKTDAGASAAVGGAYTLSPTDDTYVWIKIYWKRSTDVDTSNGIASLSTSSDGTTFTERIAATNLDFYTYADMKYLRFGTVATSSWTATTFTQTWDSVEWRADDCFN